MEFYATCPLGFEQLLAAELRSLGCKHVRPLQGQVSFDGEQRVALRACLWSRLASRIVAVLARGDAHDSDALYATASAIPWEEHLGHTATFAIAAQGTNDALRDTRYVAQRTKDAIVDRMLAKTGIRPQTDPRNPGLTLSVRISRDHAIIGVDLSGEPLFRRGYDAARSRHAPLAPLRPDYAAALLMLGGWHDQDERALVLPFVGAGTLAVEALGIAAGWPAGLARPNWGFAGWQALDQRVWKAEQTRAQKARGHGDGRVPEVYLADLRDGSQTATRHLLRAAGFSAELPHQAHTALADGLEKSALVVCDLSWLDADDVSLQAAALSALSLVAGRLPEGSSATALATGSMTDEMLGTPQQTIEVFVGRDLASLRTYESLAAKERTTVTFANGSAADVLVPQSEQFAARLAKNARLRRKWAQREDISCYRVYDADLPDYAVSIDLYEGVGGRGRWLQIYEYAAPKDIDAELARRRLLDVVAIAPHVLDVRPENCFVRVRTHARGGSQYADETRDTRYQRRAAGSGVPLPPGAHLVEEGGLTFEVNFQTRLDCGIFLDHRETRSMLREMAKQTKGSKRFLNLFAYTGSGTCYAADGGARHTTTVDLSRPSLDWARRNMERNGFSGDEHEYVQADVVRWIGEQRRTRNRWDLVFCDVPTFSNSKRMGSSSFDVQRDHAELLIGVSRLLTHDGVCVFSCNLRTFKPDVDKLARAGVEIEDITAQTIPEDFARNQRIHHCYLVRRIPRAEAADGTRQRKERKDRQDRTGQRGPRAPERKPQGQRRQGRPDRPGQGRNRAPHTPRHS